MRFRRIEENEKKLLNKFLLKIFFILESSETYRKKIKIGAKKKNLCNFIDIFLHTF